MWEIGHGDARGAHWKAPGPRLSEPQRVRWVEALGLKGSVSQVNSAAARRAAGHRSYSLEPGTRGRWLPRPRCIGGRNIFQQISQALRAESCLEAFGHERLPQAAHGFDGGSRDHGLLGEGFAHGDAIGSFVGD